MILVKRGTLVIMLVIAAALGVGLGAAAVFSPGVFAEPQ